MLLLATTLVAGAFGWLRAPHDLHYRANTTIYVGARQFTTGEGNVLSGDQSAGLERVARTFAQMIRSKPIAADAIELTGVALDTGSVVNATAAGLIPDTNLIVITVTTGDPGTAQVLADGIADAFVTKVQEFEPSAPAGEGTLPSLPAYVFERATFPTQPLPTAGLRDVGVAALFGFLAAAAFVLLLDYLDITLRSADEVERRLGLPVLGAVPRQRQASPLPIKVKPGARV